MAAVEDIMEMVRQNSTEDQRETPMDVDAGAAAPPVVQIAQVDYQNLLPRLSEQLKLDDLWDVLGSCLKDLSRTTDHHAVLVLQPAVEAFFILHAGAYFCVFLLCLIVIYLLAYFFR